MWRTYGSSHTLILVATTALSYRSSGTSWLRLRKLKEERSKWATLTCQLRKIGALSKTTPGVKSWPTRRLSLCTVITRIARIGTLRTTRRTMGFTLGSQATLTPMDMATGTLTITQEQASYHITRTAIMPTAGIMVKGHLAASTVNNSRVTTVVRIRSTILAITMGHWLRLAFMPGQTAKGTKRRESGIKAAQSPSSRPITRAW